MGADIHGWVEIRHTEEAGWYRAIDAGWLLNRDYKSFGLLFGVRNSSGFSPITPNRGLPTDASQEVMENEILRDPGMGCHSHSWLSWAELEAVNWSETDPDTGLIRRESLDDSFQMVFEMMETLAKRLGGENVRLVVWFDN